MGVGQSTHLKWALCGAGEEPDRSEPRARECASLEEAGFEELVYVGLRAGWAMGVLGMLGRLGSRTL